MNTTTLEDDSLDYCETCGCSYDYYGCKVSVCNFPIDEGEENYNDMDHEVDSG